MLAIALLESALFGSIHGSKRSSDGVRTYRHVENWTFTYLVLLLYRTFNRTLGLRDRVIVEDETHWIFYPWYMRYFGKWAFRSFGFRFQGGNYLLSYIRCLDENWGCSTQVSIFQDRLVGGCHRHLSLYQSFCRDETLRSQASSINSRVRISPHFSLVLLCQSIIVWSWAHRSPVLWNRDFVSDGIHNFLGIGFLDIVGHHTFGSQGFSIHIVHWCIFLDTAVHCFKAVLISALVSLLESIILAHGWTFLSFHNIQRIVSSWFHLFIHSP